jgi:hypothetical protein
MSESLSPEIQSHVDGLEAAKTTVRELTEGLTDEQFNWRVEEGSWSIGECIDHLYEAGSKMVSPFNEKIEAGRQKGLTGTGPFKYGFLGNWFVNQSSDNVTPKKGRIKTPALYAPGSDLKLDELVPKFITLQDDLIATVQSANGLDLKKIKAASPALKIIVLSMGQWFNLVTSHQRRHFDQAQRVKDQFPW